MADPDAKMEANETEADVKWFSGNSSKSSNTGVDDVTTNKMDETLPPIKFHQFEPYYNMTGEKHLIVFNHRNFRVTRYFGRRQPSERKYTERDVYSLQDTFESLGFKPAVYNDLTHLEILKEMENVCKKDHRATSCIVVAIMSHGDDGSVFASDRPYQLSDVTNMLQNCPGLVGKPKLLFVQACRGQNMDDGKRVVTDGGQNIVLPTHADMLITYSSAENHVAYRDSEGSWLMQSLCAVLNEYHQTYDLLQMVTFVHQAVAYRSTYTRYEETTNKKAMPETKFTLTKLLKL